MPFAVDERAVNDYYPFGMLVKERSWTSENYRYGFGGKENDNEIKGTGNSIDYGARIYDPRVARWLSRDPLEAKYVGLSGYNFAGNNPIYFVDPDGKRIIKHSEIGNDFTKTRFNVIHDYLMQKNSSYKSALGKFAHSNDKDFTLYLGIDIKKISPGAKATTRKIEGNADYNSKGKITKVNRLLAETNYLPEKPNSKITFFDIFALVHESIHIAEYTSLKALSFSIKNQELHNSFAVERWRCVKVLNELNIDLKLGLSKDDIEILSFTGAEKSNDFKKFIDTKAKTNKTTYNEELTKYIESRDKLLSKEVSLDNINSKSNSNSNDNKSVDDKKQEKKE